MVIIQLKQKFSEAEAAVKAGGQEIDMVINIGKALGGDWDYVQQEIKLINETVTKHNAILKVIFENDYLQDEQIIKLARSALHSQLLSLKHRLVMDLLKVIMVSISIKVPLFLI